MKNNSPIQAPSRKRRILHWFGIHTWEQWGEPVVQVWTNYGDILHGIYEKPFDEQVLIQRRKCLVCGEIDERQI